MSAFANVPVRALFQDIPQGYGITWNGYKGTVENHSCKTADDTLSDFQKLVGYSRIRVYGTDCGQPENVINAARATGKKVFMGIFFLDSVPAQIQTIVNAVQATGGSWDVFETISIGNEDVERGTPVGTVIAAVQAARSQLRAAGYQGPVVHVDTQSAILANPQLCGPDAGDFVAANIHPFFNPNIIAAASGWFVAQQVRALERCAAAHSRKRDVQRVVVTETGWPARGQNNGHAVPGRLHQVAAIMSIRKHLKSDVFLFSAFNSGWKEDTPGTFGAERFWGIYDNGDS
ncbi:glycoside hydrolase [Trichodelitschia bisporula]|uniref:Glycoside hydrolase n=1 Tax=Trichodelitschia bisporula TaxID=703511 RepID=A0A6G1HVL4_9PEZI|nr:glycoside hydrolase [Trichodelitschia bisporula]